MPDSSCIRTILSRKRTENGMLKLPKNTKKVGTFLEFMRPFKLFLYSLFVVTEDNKVRSKRFLRCNLAFLPFRNLKEVVI